MSHTSTAETEPLEARLSLHLQIDASGCIPRDKVKFPITMNRWIPTNYIELLENGLCEQDPTKPQECVSLAAPEDTYREKMAIMKAVSTQHH